MFKYSKKVLSFTSLNLICSILFPICKTDEQRQIVTSNGGIAVGIGRNSHIKRAIVDKNARIGDNVKVKHHICHLLYYLL